MTTSSPKILIKNGAYHETNISESSGGKGRTQQPLCWNRRPQSCIGEVHHMRFDQKKKKEKEKKKKSYEHDSVVNTYGTA